MRDIYGGGVDPSAFPSWSSGFSHGYSSLHRRLAGKVIRLPTGSSQRDIGLRVVCMCLHVNRWFVLCVCVLQSGHVGVGCMSGEILCRYSVNSGHLFALSCARVRLYLR